MGRPSFMSGAEAQKTSSVRKSACDSVTIRSDVGTLKLRQTPTSARTLASPPPQDDRGCE